MRVAVIGVGHFGSLLAEKYASMDHVDLVAVVDQDIDRANKIAIRYGCKALTDYTKLAGQVDAAKRMGSS